MTERDRDFSVFLPNIAVFLFVAFGVFVSRPPLKSARPIIGGADPTEGESSVKIATMPAHLWQDPLPARARQIIKPDYFPETDHDGLLDPFLREASAIGQNDSSESNENQASNLAQPNPILLLPILVSGKLEPDDIEVRLRSRYAVLSALARAQYVPVRGDRLNFLRLWNDKWPGPVLVAFEEFKVRTLVADRVGMSGQEKRNFWPLTVKGPPPTALEIPAASDRVFVIWLDESALMRTNLPEPRRNDSQLPNNSALLPRRIEQVLLRLISEKWRSKVVVRVIGPSSSDALISFVERSPNLPLLDAEVLSPRATAADEVLQITATREESFASYNLYKTDGVTNASARPFWPIERTITSDDHLVDALLHELSLRDVRPGPDQHIVIVGEWDSLYARSLSRTFAAKLWERAGLCEPEDGAGKLALWSTNPPYMHEFSYLRGLDGNELGSPTKDASAATQRPPGQQSDLSDDQDSAMAKGNSPADRFSLAEPERTRLPTEGELERAEGTSQFDYLRRLEQRLSTLQTNLHRQPRRATIAAIGVMGSDIYDKLLVLRALRRSFPEAIFFTTDVHALYFHQDETEWTSNLLIASAFGLQSSDLLQDRVPPFRDSYETSLYLTVLKALGVRFARTDDATFNNRVPSPPNPHSEEVSTGSTTDFALGPAVPPRVFEVGRDRLIDLSSLEGSAATNAQLHPSPPRAERLRWMSLAGLILFGTLLSAALLWYVCVHKNVRVEGGGDWQQNVRGVIADLSNDFMFGLVWMIFTCGTIVWLVSRATWLLPLNVRMVPAATVGGILYLWLFYAIVCRLRKTGVTTWLGHTFDWSCRAGVLLLSLASIRWIVFAIDHVLHDGTEEAFAWFSGVSIWPTEFVRMLAILFGVFFVIRAQWLMEQRRRLIATQFGLVPPQSLDSQISLWEWVRIHRWPELFWMPEDSHARSVTIESHWQHYCLAMSIRRRTVRILTYVVLALIASCALFEVLGWPVVPARGEWSRALDHGINWTAALIFCYLLMLVFDATVITRLFVERLTRTIGVDPKLSEYETIDLISDLSEVAGNLVYLPFTILFMLVVARNSLFDAWTWPPDLLAVLGAGLALIITSQRMLQRACGRAKAEALCEINRKLHCHLKAAPQKGFRQNERSLREQRDLIAGYDGTVFQTWLYNPLFRAILIPIGGLGSLQLLSRFWS